ncbi:RNA 2'-phosphotransferase [Gimesia aquarii]|uniref:Probable RNA 2'-phosphotransferase n=1 Tax=Gimesia aquarii TaxID=2527964 RepID=A0A517VU13_9PLAN|nr:RNA 2'-phosphotransferase [Gimesia aquarii]QDT96470.1 RNA 2'-phosphotransferase [Gimesia aquarii]
MNEKEIRKKSKFLSLVLRHQPETIGIELDESGWVDIETLLTSMAEHGKTMSRETLELVVNTNDKQRFSLSEDGMRIRANQGHSVKIDLGYQAAIPPEILFHGTPQQFVGAIAHGGLMKMKRHHVHLHVDEKTSLNVGSRRGNPVLLKVRALEMHQAGFEFFVTPNEVWLTDHVPVVYIEFPR